MRTTRSSFQRLIIGGLLLSCAIPGNTQTVVGVVCSDGSSHPAGFNCGAYLCSTGWAQSHGLGYGCASSGTGTGTTVNPAVQGAASSLYDASEQLGYKLGQWLFGGNKSANDPAAAAAAAEAEREQKEALARQEALREQQRQAMFNRLSQELKMSAFGDMQLKGFDNSVGQMQLKGFGDTTSNTGGGEMALKGFGDTPSSDSTSLTVSNATTPVGGQTCFFGECGPQNPDLNEPIEPWNDPKVVDLRDLQQGVDLAVVATKAQPADRQAIMDQALAAADGNTRIQVTIPSDSFVPVMSQQGLLAFQQANNVYRQAHNDAYQLQQSYQLDRQRQQAAEAITTETERELENYLRQHTDEITLEQKQLAMAQIFDAALQEELAYGKSWAQYLAARQRYYQDRYELELYLWNTALGKQGNPPSLPPQLTAPTSPANSDLSLVLPFTQPIAAPTKEDLSLLPPLTRPIVAPTKQDMKFLMDIQLQGSTQPPDIITQKVLAELQQQETNAETSNRLTEGAIANLEHHDEADNQLAAQPPQVFPPNILNQYRSNPQFQQKMNAEYQVIEATKQQTVENAVQEADRQWQQKLSQLQRQGLLDPSIPWAQQAQNNLQLAAQLAAAQKQVTANLDYNATRANYQAQRQWQQWIQQQESTLQPPPITLTSAVRD